MRLRTRRKSSAKLDPIGAYLAELEAELGVRRLLRRRVLCEVRLHLHESADELVQCNATTRSLAEREAVARFGGVEELARGLKSVCARRSLVANRLVTLSVAWAAAMAMGSATVWAAVDLQSTASIRAQAGVSHRVHASATRSHRALSIKRGGAAARLRCDTHAAARGRGCDDELGARKGR